jgi:hypothetical protein
MKAGYAEADITYESPTTLGGYGIPGGVRVSDGIHDRLLAQAAVFINDRDETFVIVSIDSIGFFFDYGTWAPGALELCKQISDSLKGTFPVKPDHILIVSTHSHATPDIEGFWQKAGEGPDKLVLAGVAAGISGAVAGAVSAMKPAALYFGRTELAGYSGRKMNCSAVIDNSVEILQARDGAGTPIVTIANYAKHPTVLPETNNTISADFIWGFREEMKKSTGAPAIFLQGFEAAVVEGPLMASLPGADDWERAYNMGGVLAAAAQAATGSLSKSSSLDIEHRHADYTCKAEGDLLMMVNDLFGTLKRYMHKSKGSMYVDNLRVTWHRLGDAEFATFPGEGDPEYGLALKARMASPWKFTTSLSNDSVGYILTPGAVEADTGGQLKNYELKMGLGMPAGPCTWDATASMGWFDGAWKNPAPARALAGSR